MPGSYEPIPGHAVVGRTGIGVAIMVFLTEGRRVGTVDI